MNTSIQMRGKINECSSNGDGYIYLSIVKYDKDRIPYQGWFLHPKSVAGDVKYYFRIKLKEQCSHPLTALSYSKLGEDIYCNKCKKFIKPHKP